MKTLIIGIDALEYDLVKKYNLKNLLQKEYGKTIVPLGKSGYPQTVQVWASFLTGKISNLQKFNTKASPLLNKLYAPLIKIKNLFPLNGKINSLGRRIFSKVNTQFPKLKEKTFIE